MWKLNLVNAKLSLYLATMYISSLVLEAVDLKIVQSYN